MPSSETSKKADYLRRWLPMREGQAAGMTLVCLPHAGAGISSYVRWVSRKQRVQVCPVLLPGREARIVETPITSIDIRVMDSLNRGALPRAFAHERRHASRYRLGPSAGARAPSDWPVSWCEGMTRAWIEIMALPLPRWVAGSIASPLWSWKRGLRGTCKVQVVGAIRIDRLRTLQRLFLGCA